MGFHLGRPILVMIALACAAGATSYFTQSSDQRADVELWTFSESSQRTYTGSLHPANAPLALRDFETETGKTAAVRLIQFRALNTRLANLFMSGTGYPEVPDVVEVEIGFVGRFFRPPVDQVGFLPLNDYIERNGWTDKLVANRFAPWTKDGVIFGLPHDVHPVVIAYNDELFRQAGVDLASSDTWDAFVANCLRFQAFWRQQGVDRRWALELNESNAGVLVTMLLQRGINVVDEQYNIHLTDPKVLDTLCRYVRMMSGAGQIGVTTAAGNQTFSQDLQSGYVGAMICADWRLKYLRDYAPGVAGKMKVMPLPAWPDSPYRTSTIGGTMGGIPRTARDPDAAWKLLEKIYLSDRGIRDQVGTSYIVPVVKSFWNDPLFDEADDFYSGQQVRKVLRDLADNVPPRYVSPASAVAEAELSMLMISAISYYREHGEDGFEDHCRGLLEWASNDVAARIAHGSFE